MILRDFWKKAMEKLDKFAAFLPAIGEQIKIHIEEGDVEAIRARVRELREATAALDRFGDRLEKRIADSELDAVEAIESLGDLDEAIDELEDVVKGYDEDDSPSPEG